MPQRCRALAGGHAMTVAPKPAGEVETWDDEVDVIIVGFGAAGASAAYEAAAAGASVARAGARRRSRRRGRDVGRVRLPRRRHARAAAGRLRRHRREHAHVPQSRHAVRPPTRRRSMLYCDRSLEHRDWLVERGVEFLGTVMPHANGTSAARRRGLDVHRRRERATRTTRSRLPRRAVTSPRAAVPAAEC